MSQPIEVNCVELMPNTAVGMSRECPDKESTPLQEELLFHEEGTRELWLTYNTCNTLIKCAYLSFWPRSKLLRVPYQR
jgi:hypothetical protein